MADFLNRPDWREVCDEILYSVLKGRPLHAVYNTIGKKEKKKFSGEPTGSRMVAFLDAPMRLVKAKIFGSAIDLVKPAVNRFGVGGLGVHDLGMRLEEIFKETALGSDIAGFDTRVGVVVDSMMAHLFSRLSTTSCHRELMYSMYRIYTHPMLLIPYDHGGYMRSQLLSGRGQVMSGRSPTYSANTLIRVAIAMVEISRVHDIPDEQMRRFTADMISGTGPYAPKWGIACSGDDCVISG